MKVSAWRERKSASSAMLEVVRWASRRACHFHTSILLVIELRSGDSWSGPGAEMGVVVRVENGEAWCSVGGVGSRCRMREG